MALITQLLGVRTVLGAFMAGVLIGESPILTDHIQGQLRGMITAFFMPIFFGMSGLAADLTILKDVQAGGADRRCWWPSPRSENSPAPLPAPCWGG